MINFLFTALVLIVPLILNLANSEFFEVPKMYTVYLISLLLLVSHLFNYLLGNAPLVRKNLLFWPLIIFLLSQAVSTFFSIDTHTSIYGYYSRLNGGLLSLLSYSIIFLTFSVYRTPTLTSWLTSASLFTGLIVSSYGILEHFGIDKGFWVQDVQSRVFSTLGQPNWLAAYLCILLPLALDRFLSSSRPIHKSYFIFLTSIFYICLLFTKSKSGILAALISLTMYSLIHLYKNRFRPHFTFYLPSGRHGLLLFTLVFFSVSITNPIKDILFPSRFEPTSPTTITPLLITPSKDIRKIVWQGSIDLWRQFPLFGTGPETFAYSYYWTRPSSHNLTSEWNFIYNKAHNEYLNYLATSGSFGFISYLVLIGFMIYTLKSFPALLASFVSILITNFAGFSVVTTSLYFFLLPTFIAQDQITIPRTSPNTIQKFFSLCLILVSSYWLLVTFKYFLADIAYHRQSLTELRYALNFRPDEPVYLSKYALVLAESSAATKDKSQIPHVVKALDTAISISPFNLNLWKERAQGFYFLSLIDSKYYVYTVDALTKATRLAPTDASSFYLLAKFYQNISEMDSAITNYQHALTLKPNYDHASFALGEIFYQQKKYSESKIMFDKTLLLAPSNTDAKEYLDKISNLAI
ncbi:MAG: O-antigen ligase family protein [Candidatus Levybacteria bacterium]|nr:O-antigen ligase family protein [Candidatus Levybacteria bacterium]